MTIPIAPPRPAPYLEGAPRLADELLARLSSRRALSPAEEAAIQAEVDRVTAEILARRQAYEAEHGVEIVPERWVAE